MESTFVKVSDIAPTAFRNKFESPIEEKMYAALRKFLPISMIETQKKIGPYRADIFINSKHLKIVVECDGEQFHKDLERDRKRDFYMEGIGIKVLRFTGSQISKKPQLCAMWVVEFVSEVYHSKAYQDFIEMKLGPSAEDAELTQDEIELGCYIDQATGQKMYS